MDDASGMDDVDRADGPGEEPFEARPVGQVADDRFDIFAERAQCVGLWPGAYERPDHPRSCPSLTWVTQR